MYGGGFPPPGPFRGVAPGFTPMGYPGAAHYGVPYGLSRTPSPINETATAFEGGPPGAGNPDSQQAPPARWANERLKAIQDKIDASRQSAPPVAPQVKSAQRIQSPPPEQPPQHTEDYMQQAIRERVAAEAEERRRMRENAALRCDEGNNAPLQTYLPQPTPVMSLEERKRAEQRMIEETVAMEAEQRRRVREQQAGVVHTPVLSAEARKKAEERAIAEMVFMEAQERHAQGGPEAVTASALPPAEGPNPSLAGTPRTMPPEAMAPLRGVEGAEPWWPRDACPPWPPRHLMMHPQQPHLDREMPLSTHRSYASEDAEQARQAQQRYDEQVQALQQYEQAQQAQQKYEQAQAEQARLAQQRLDEQQRKAQQRYEQAQAEQAMLAQQQHDEQEKLAQAQRQYEQSQAEQARLARQQYDEQVQAQQQYDQARQQYEQGQAEQARLAQQQYEEQQRMAQQKYVQAEQERMAQQRYEQAATERARYEAEQARVAQQRYAEQVQQYQPHTQPTAADQDPPGLHRDELAIKQQGAAEYRAMLEKELQATRSLRRQLEAGNSPPKQPAPVPAPAPAPAPAAAVLSPGDLDRQELRTAVNVQTERLHSLRSELSDMMSRANSTLEKVSPNRSTKPRAQPASSLGSASRIPPPQAGAPRDVRGAPDLEAFAARLKTERASEQQRASQSQQLLESEIARDREQSAHLAERMRAMDAAGAKVDGSPRAKYGLR